jgi:hypothetical protein
MPNYHTTAEGNIPFTAEEEAEWEARIVAHRIKLDELAKIAYKDKRANEYPQITDYLDGIVKGDQVQIQAYIDACLAVKAKYPKP